MALGITTYHTYVKEDLLMKITKKITLMVLLVAVFGHVSSYAYSPEELKKDCKKPRFTDFTLAPYSAADNNQIPAEATFSFKVSAWTDPSTIKVTAKGQEIPFTVESNSTFHKVNSKLPATLNGEFVRLNVYADAVLGCDSSTGWLIKIAQASH